MKANTRGRKNTQGTENKALQASENKAPEILSAKEYFERKRAGEIAPGTGSRTENTEPALSAKEYFVRKRAQDQTQTQDAQNAPEKPEKAPKTAQTRKSPKSTEKPVKTAQSTRKQDAQNKKPSAAALMQSVPNKDTNKPGKREEARKNMADFEAVLVKLTKAKSRNLVSYTDRIAGLYRLQITINGKLKTIARVKLQRDVYILVREKVAQELNWDYDLINYNLPAGTHFQYTEDKAKNAIEALYNLFEEGEAD